jgi:hypothetical protein
VSSVVKLRTFVNASNLPIAVPGDMQREYLARPRLFHRNHFHRNHEVTYPCDASASHVLDDLPAHEAHRAFSQDFPLPGRDR